MGYNNLPPMNTDETLVSETWNLLFLLSDQRVRAQNLFARYNSSISANPCQSVDRSN